jgi:hypothetical protein
MGDVSILVALGEGTTLSGRKILLPGRRRENRLRSLIAELCSSVVSELSSRDIADDALRNALRALRIAYARRIPRVSTRRKGVSIHRHSTRAAVFDHWDGIHVLISEDGEFTSFAKRAGLDTRIDYSTTFGLIALLLIDSVVERLERHDVIRAACELLHAAEAREELLYESRARVWQQHARQTVARAGGLAAYRTHDEYRRRIIEKWKSGAFRTKAAASRWATNMERMNVNPRTVERWLREQERGESDTQQEV